MSRYFDGVGGNFLQAINPDLIEDKFEYTICMWVKDDWSGEEFGRPLFSTGDTVEGNTSSRLWAREDGRLQVRIEGGDNPRSDVGTLPDLEWAFVAYRRINGTDPVHEAFINATQEISSPGANLSRVRADAVDITIGSDFASTNTAKGNIAHCSVFWRALSDSEIDQLAAGVNPESIDPTDRYFYAPMETESLENVWSGENDSASTLTVMGTVPFDADNPTVDAPAASLAANNPPQGGEVFQFSGSNYAAQPTGPMTFTQGTRTISRAVTISNWDAEEGSFTGVTDTALPGVPAAGASDTPALLYGEPVTISLPDPGA